MATVGNGSIVSHPSKCEGWHPVVGMGHGDQRHSLGHPPQHSPDLYMTDSREEPDYFLFADNSGVDADKCSSQHEVPLFLTQTAIEVVVISETSKRIFIR